MVRQVTPNGPQNSEARTTNSERQGRRPTTEQIRLRAFQIYEARGRTAGHEVEDWTQAERELKRNF